MNMKTIAFLIATPELPSTATGQYNGYVAVPPEHPLYRKSNFDPEVENLDVHGGVTFAGYEKTLPWASVYLDHQKPRRNWWVFGFDTCHYGDNSDKWNRENCTEETRRLQEQLEELFAQSK